MRARTQHRDHPLEQLAHVTNSRDLDEPISKGIKLWLIIRAKQHKDNFILDATGQQRFFVKMDIEKSLTTNSQRGLLLRKLLILSYMRLGLEVAQILPL
jgi:hypothetical protein